MTANVPSSHECVILDACCVINLFATGRMADIFEALPQRIAIAALVHDEEALRIAGDPEDEGNAEDETIILQPLIERGLLVVVAPETEEESNTFITFAVTLDDGEAITGAIATHRNWAIGSDDGAAIRFFRRHTPPLHVITTPEFIKHWADTREPSSDEIRSVLRRVRRRARYGPSARHPLHTWWRAHT